MLGASITGTIGGARWEGRWLVLGGVHARRYRKGQSELTVRCLLYGVSCMVLMLSSCVGGGADSIFGEAIGLNPPGPNYVSQGAGSSFRWRRHLWGAVRYIDEDSRRGLVKLLIVAQRFAHRWWAFSRPEGNKLLRSKYLRSDHKRARGPC